MTLVFAVGQRFGCDFAKGALPQPRVLVLSKGSGCPRGKLKHAAHSSPWRKNRVRNESQWSSPKAKVTLLLGEQVPAKSDKTMAFLKELDPLHGSHCVTKIRLCPLV